MISIGNKNIKLILFNGNIELNKKKLNNLINKFKKFNMIKLKLKT
jgi:hypothetical protein